MSEREEKKNQRIGLLASVGIHFTLLVLFLFAMGWSAPDPPLSEYGSGVELNFGLDSEGSGEIQPETAVGEQVVTPEEVKASENPAKQEEPQPQEEKKEEVKPEDNKTEDNLTSKEDSPVEVKETKKATRKVVDPPKEKVIETKDKPVRKENAEEKSTKEVAAKKANEDGTKKQGGAKSQGDDKNKTGDKGSPEGSLDPNGQYTGKPGTGGGGNGGGNGFGLQMSGWKWDAQPQAPKLPDNENGRIVFEIEVDVDGEITRITTLERGLSPEAEKLCKQEIQKRSLIHTAGGSVPERSTGRITFVLRTL